MKGVWARRWRDHLLASEAGGALLIALLAAAVMLFVGMVLFEVVGASVSLGATTQAKIQAEMLSQKGLDEALVRIREAVDGNQIQNKACPAIVTNGGSNQRGSSSVRITATVPSTIKRDPDLYVCKFEITSTGKIPRTRDIIVSKRMIVYVSNINPVFRYPLSANGDLKLNGASSIIGDVLVRGGEVKTDIKAYFVDEVNSKYYFNSDLASILGFMKVKSKTNMFSKMNPSDYSQNIPLLDHTMEDDQVVAIGSKVEDKIKDINPDDFDNITSKDFEMKEEFRGNKKVETASTIVNGKHLIRGSFLVNNGSLFLEENPELTLSEGSLYVINPMDYLVAADFRGKIKVDSNQMAVVDGDVTINDGFEFSGGSMYIRGNLKIFGNVKLNGTIFVNGDVGLNEMKALNRSSEDSSPLIIMSTGRIILGDNESAFIRAFLYSKQPITIYGVKSKLTIDGGIHGESGDDPTLAGVELNAVRGEIGGELWTTPATKVEGNKEMQSSIYIQEDQKGLAADTSRLQIRFDPDLYEKPPDGIPTIDGYDVFVQNISYLK